MTKQFENLFDAMPVDVRKRDDDEARDLMENIYSPDNLKNRVNISTLTRAAFAKKIDVSVHTFNNWCLPYTSKGHRDMPQRKWVLLLQKK